MGRGPDDGSRGWPRELWILLALVAVSVSAFVLYSLVPTRVDDCAMAGGAGCPDAVHELGASDLGLAAVVLLLFALFAVRLVRWNRDAEGAARPARV